MILGIGFYHFNNNNNNNNNISLQFWKLNGEFLIVCVSFDLWIQWWNSTFSYMEWERFCYGLELCWRWQVDDTSFIFLTHFFEWIWQEIIDWKLMIIFFSFVWKVQEWIHSLEWLLIHLKLKFLNRRYLLQQIFSTINMCIYIYLYIILFRIGDIFYDCDMFLLYIYIFIYLFIYLYIYIYVYVYE
jgi:hypothetical protein